MAKVKIYEFTPFRVDNPFTELYILRREAAGVNGFSVNDSPRTRSMGLVPYESCLRDAAIGGQRLSADGFSLTILDMPAELVFLNPEFTRDLTGRYSVVRTIWMGEANLVGDYGVANLDGIERGDQSDRYEFDPEKRMFIRPEPETDLHSAYEIIFDGVASDRKSQWLLKINTAQWAYKLGSQFDLFPHGGAWALGSDTIVAKLAPAEDYTT